MKPPLTLLPPRQSWRPAFRDLSIDVDLGRVVVAGRLRRLEPQQQVILGSLLVHRWVGFEMLQDTLWGSWLEPPDTQLNTIRVRICQLRRKLEGTGAAIVNLHSRGYALELLAIDNCQPMMISSSPEASMRTGSPAPDQ